MLRQLIKTGIQGNPEDFRRVSEQVIKEERQKQHHLLANDLEKILYGNVAKPYPGIDRIQDKIPIDIERGLPLMFIKEPVHQLEDVVLSEENQSIIDRILLEHRRSDVIKSYGLRSADKLLFFGPPGCGKTLTTEIIASELNLPFAIVRIESVISSYLGETAANLRKIFDFIDTTATVVLFDEFDALAKERSDTADHGELKRVVNTVLQMMDAYRGKSLIVAATNREVILDDAIWRRFEEVIHFKMPDQKHIRKLLPMKLRGVRCDFSTDDVEIAELFNADIERTLRSAIKDMILSGQEFLRKSHIKKALDREKSRQHRLKNS